ncbi:MAG: PAS domain S-box protein [Candidatus Aerophobetes bacterium]|nr:PAS domain S-box protein [Candidatus Aerophobetes bacterium]
MKDERKTKDELIEELVKLRTRVADLEKRESEKKYWTFIENANEAIIVAQGGMIKFVNPKACQISGYSKKEIISRPFVEFVHPDDQKMAIKDHLKTLKDKKVLFPYSTRIIGKGGNIRWVETSTSLIDWEGGPATLDFLTDITERKRAEEALQESEHNYRTLFENTLDGVFVIDAETMKVVLANQTIARIYGFDSVEDGIGAGLFDFIPSEEKDRTSKIIGEDMFKYDLRQVNQFQTTTKDGRTIWVEARGARIEYRGRPAGLVSIRDITEQKKAEEQLKASLKEKEILLKEIHHRVKNNLQIISSLLNLEAGYIKDGKELKRFEECQRRIGTMALIHEKLSESRDLAKVDFAEYTRSLVAGLYHSYELGPEVVKLKTSIGDVSLSIDEAIPCGLIINELVSNSLKHAFPQGRKGKICIELHQNTEGKITLIVDDDGVGFPQDVDFRATESLGLQLVTTLVEQLEGTIELDKTAGTAFTVTFTPPK